MYPVLWCLVIRCPARSQATGGSRSRVPGNNYVVCCTMNHLHESNLDDAEAGMTRTLAAAVIYTGNICNYSARNSLRCIFFLTCNPWFKVALGFLGYLDLFLCRKRSQLGPSLRQSAPIYASPCRWRRRLAGKPPKASGLVRPCQDRIQEQRQAKTGKRQIPLVSWLLVALVAPLEWTPWKGYFHGLVVSLCLHSWNKFISTGLVHGCRSLILSHSLSLSSTSDCLSYLLAKVLPFSSAVLTLLGYLVHCSIGPSIGPFAHSIHLSIHPSINQSINQSLPSRPLPCLAWRKLIRQKRHFN